MGFKTLRGRGAVYDYSSAWLTSGLPEIGRYGLFVDGEAASSAGPLLARGDPLPAIEIPLTVPSMKVTSCRREGDDWSGDVDLGSAGVVFLKKLSAFFEL